MPLHRTLRMKEISKEKSVKAEDACAKNSPYFPTIQLPILSIRMHGRLHPTLAVIQIARNANGENMRRGRTHATCLDCQLPIPLSSLQTPNAII